MAKLFLATLCDGGRFEHVFVPSAGVYEFALCSDGHGIGTLPVEVVQAPARVVH